MDKTAHIEDFVGQFDGFISDGQCDNLIDFYNWSAKNNRSWSRQDAEGCASTIKADNSTTYRFDGKEDLTLGWPNIGRYVQEFNDVFWNECYPIYLDRYGVLKDAAKHGIETYKVQKTRPQEGYHTWHCEDLDRAYSTRIGAYILYLNDVEEGGETEFLYLSKRIKPKKGRLIIFPSGYTHTHRGNPPLSGDKLILTGWLEFN
jgi:hypothetical protein